MKEHYSDIAIAVAGAWFLGGKQRQKKYEVE